MYKIRVHTTLYDGWSECSWLFDLVNVVKKCGKFCSPKKSPVSSFYFIHHITPWSHNANCKPPTATLNSLSPYHTTTSSTYNTYQRRMAAILCKSISNLCSGACTGCGQLCKLPCTICSSVCKPACETIKKVCSSPFCIFTTLALGLNIPPIIFGLSAVAYGGCKGSQWLSVNMLFCIAHIIAAIYLAMQSKSFNETMQTLCYDPWIAVYILVGIASLVWLWVGTGWAATGEMLNGNNCPDNIGKLTYDSIYCGHAFFGLGFAALFISVFVSMCTRGRDQTNDNGTEQNAGGGGKYWAFNKVWRRHSVIFVHYYLKKTSHF